MNTALLLSGGIGSRLSAGKPKQYLPICGRMLITYALEPLLDSPLIDAVEIVAERTWQEAILQDAGQAGLSVWKVSGFATPGTNRQSSIINGLKDILFRENEKADIEDVEDTDTVLIHDAARPLLSDELIASCYAALGGHDGVMPVLPMKDTVYLSRDGRRVDGLFKRSHIYGAQAPELFLLKKYYRANTALTPEQISEIKGSTEPAVMAGMDIAVIPGEEKNFKVTTREDLQRFRSYMEQEKGFMC